jgi:hypothetical protein
MALEILPTSTLSELTRPPTIGERREATLKALFEARVPRRNDYALSLNYAFMTTGGTPVYAFDRGVLRAGHYSEDLNSPTPDIRGAFTRPGWYTLGRPRKATIEWRGKYWVVIRIDRADDKEGAQ